MQKGTLQLIQWVRVGAEIHSGSLHLTPMPWGVPHISSSTGDRGCDSRTTKLEGTPITHITSGKAKGLGFSHPHPPLSPGNFGGWVGRRGREQGSLNHSFLSTCCVQAISILASCYPHTFWRQHQPIKSKNGSLLSVCHIFTVVLNLGPELGGCGQ